MYNKSHKYTVLEDVNFFGGMVLYIVVLSVQTEERIQKFRVVFLLGP